MLVIKILFVIGIIVCIGLIVLDVHLMLEYNQIVESFQTWINDVDDAANSAFQREARLMEDRLYRSLMEKINNNDNKIDDNDEKLDGEDTIS